MPAKAVNSITNGTWQLVCGAGVVSGGRMVNRVTGKQVPVSNLQVLCFTRGNFTGVCGIQANQYTRKLGVGGFVPGCAPVIPTNIAPLAGLATVFTVCQHGNYIYFKRPRHVAYRVAARGGKFYLQQQIPGTSKYKAIRAFTTQIQAITFFSYLH